MSKIYDFKALNNHGVTFPLMSKTEVNGPSESPVFTYLKEAAPTEEYKGLKGKATRKGYRRDALIRP